MIVISRTNKIIIIIIITISQYIDVCNASQVIHKNITTKIGLILENYIHFFAFHEKIFILKSQRIFMLRATAIQRKNVENIFSGLFTGFASRNECYRGLCVISYIV